MFGRHVAMTRVISGAYRTEYGDAAELQEAQRRIEVGLCNTHLPLECPLIN